MNVFARELKAYRKSTIIWILSLSSLVVLFLMMYPAFSGDVDVMKKILQNFPPAVRATFDLSLGNFFTIYGFLGYLMTFVTLAGAVQAMNLGVGILSKEESGKTVDFLLSKPVSRIKVVTGKLLAALSLVLMTNVVFDAVALITSRAVSKTDFDVKILLLLLSILFLIQLFFLAFGLAMSVIVKKVKSVISVSLPTVFTFFFIGTIGAILDNDSVKMFSPFKFFDTDYVIDHGTLDLKFLIIEAVCVIVAVAATYVIYAKKDIKSAI